MHHSKTITKYFICSRRLQHYQEGPGRLGGKPVNEGIRQIATFLYTIGRQIIMEASRFRSTKATIVQQQ